MILNVVDRRARPYRWKKVDVIIEPTWHDNNCDDADQDKPHNEEPGYAARNGVSVADAVVWATAISVPLTLYIYDEGSDVVAVDVPWPPKDPA